MEDLCDPLNHSLGPSAQTISKEKPFAESNISKEIDHLISQLTGKTPDQRSKSNVQETKNGDGVILGDATNVDEILATDEALISPTSHNVSVLNVACQQVLRQMEYQLLSLLKNNRNEQEVISNYLSSNCKNVNYDAVKKFSLKCAGMPYFKDSYGYQPPPNEDVLRKQKNKKLLPIDFINSYPIWNGPDAVKLITAVKEQGVKEPSIDWLKISVTDMKGKYSASECKAKWFMHLNPTINKSKWTLKEMELLKNLSAKHDYQDWDKIASELGTNRSGLQCCIQYQTHTVPREGKWTKEEDETLKELVERYRIRDCIPWKKVSWHFEVRSLKQCQERYTYHLGNIKKGNFTMEEDFVIVYMASKLKNFGEVAKFLPNRVATQVRARYEYLVETSMPKFSKEEDELLSKLMILYPRNWGKISKEFKNRSRIQCRRRWAQLQKQIHVDIDNDSEFEESPRSFPVSDGSRKDNLEIDLGNLRKNIGEIPNPIKKSKKYPEIYKKLLDYHSYCHKFLFGPKPRTPSNSEALNKLTSKIIVTMKNLSVSHTGPLDRFDLDTLSNNCEFDKEDLAVLEELKSREKEGSNYSQNFIPPNYMTLVGIKTLTLGWNLINSFCASPAEETPESSEIDINDRIFFSDAKKLFKSRMKTIFYFPLLLSYISSGEKPKLIYKQKNKKAGKPLSKRKRKMHAKLMSAAYRKKLKAMAGGTDDVQTSIQSNESNERQSTREGRSSSTTSEIRKEKPKVNRRGRKRTRAWKTEDEECMVPVKKEATECPSPFDSV